MYHATIIPESNRAFEERLNIRTNKMAFKFRRIVHDTVLIMPLIVVAGRYCCLLGAP